MCDCSMNEYTHILQATGLCVWFTPPSSWPSQSWSYHNRQQFVGHYQAASHHNSVQLCSNFEQVTSTVTPQMIWYTLHRTWQHIRLCLELDNTHKDPLDGLWPSTHGKLSRSMLTSQPSGILLVRSSGNTDRVIQNVKSLASFSWRHSYHKCHMNTIMVYWCFRGTYFLRLQILLPLRWRQNVSPAHQ